MIRGFAVILLAVVLSSFVIPKYSLFYNELVMYLPLKNTGGKIANNYSLYKNNGTLNGGAIFKNNYCLFTSGTSDWINCGSNSTLNISSGKLTISCWINATNNAQNGGVVGKWFSGAATDNSYLLLVGQDFSNNKFSFHLQQSDNTKKVLSATETYLANTWYHLVGTADGTTMKLYINGVLSATTQTYDGTIKVSTKKVVVGRLREDDNTYSFEGKIRDVMIYNRALNYTEVRSLYVKQFNL